MHDHARLSNRLINSSLIILAAIVLCLGIINEVPETTSRTNARQERRSQPLGLVFLRPGGTASELWAADLDGSNERQLLNKVIDFDVRPGGAQIVYSKEHDDFDFLASLELLDLQSGTSSVVVNDTEFLPVRPLWSPADGVIAYERRTLTVTGSGPPKVWLTQQDGSNLGPLIKGAESVSYGASWSPDGTRIVAVEAVRGKLVVFNFSETLREIPLMGEVDWSPDGGRLIISAPQAEEPPRNGLVLYDLTSGQQTPVATDDPQADDYLPRWSPDGTSIVFVRRNPSQRHGELWLLPIGADGVAGQPRALTNEPGFANMDPLWAPDNSSLLWTRYTIGGAGEKPAIWQLDLRTQGAQPQLLLENGTNPRWIR